MEDVIVPCAGFIVFWLLLFGFVALMRYMAFRETIMLADRGLTRGERRGADGKDTLRWGIVTTAVGLALCLGLYPIGLEPGNRFFLGLGPWMLAGFLPTFFGIGLIIIYLVTRDEKTPPPPTAPSRAPASDPTEAYRDPAGQ